MPVFGLDTNIQSRECLTLCLSSAKCIFHIQHTVGHFSDEGYLELSTCIYSFATM